MFAVVMINGFPFKCECSCISFKEAKTPVGEPERNYYQCRGCGSIYEKE